MAQQQAQAALHQQPQQHHSPVCQQVHWELELDPQWLWAKEVPFVLALEQVWASVAVVWVLVLGALAWEGLQVLEQEVPGQVVQ